MKKQVISIFLSMSLTSTANSIENCFTNIASVAAQGKFVGAGDVIDFNRIKMPAKGGLCGPTCAVNLADYFRNQLNKPTPYSSLEKFEFNVLKKLQGNVSNVLTGLTPGERHRPIVTALKMMGLTGWKVRKVSGEYLIRKKDITREAVPYLSGSLISLRSSFRKRGWYHFMMVGNFQKETNMLTLIEPGFPQYPIQAILKSQIVSTRRGYKQRYKIEFLRRTTPKGRVVYPTSAIIETAVIVDFPKNLK